MANIDKITDEILEEARKTAEAKVVEAKAQASEIIKNAEEECRKLKEEMAQKDEKDRKTVSERAKASAQMKKRQMILNAKQELITEILNKAYQRIFDMDDAAYFGLIEKMLQKFCLARTGEICFSEKDRKRMPDGFEQVVERVAKEKGGNLTISKESRNIDGGFVLVYGGIEENCSIQALFHSEREYLADKVHENLF